MKASLKDGFVGGLIGSVAVLLALSLLVLVGFAPKAPFVGAYQAVLGGGWVTAAVVGGLLFLFFGALWAVPFALLIPNPTILKGVLWGLLPTLWMWTFVPAVLTGGPLFGGFAVQGLVMPIIMNCLIWGSIVGWYCDNHAHPAASPAV